MTEATQTTESATFPVSFVVITRNEDLKHLQQMINTLPPDCEVCILSNMQGKEDSLSEIETINVGTRILINRKWIYTGDFDFAKARNLADEMASNDWRFWIDSDDRLAHCQHEQIRRVADTFPAGIAGAFAGVVSYEPDWRGETHAHIGSVTSAYQLRMYRGSAGAKWRGRIHEQIYPELQRLGWGARPTAIIVIHEGYNAPLHKRLEKLERNVELLIQEVANNEDDAMRSFYASYLRDAMRVMSEMQLKLKEREN